MRIDVFTLVPHAYAWLTEQVPVANVLGTELELRLFNYRDSTPLRAGLVDDEPYGGGAGMVLRVDVVAAALEAAYGGQPPGPVIALTPQGRLEGDLGFPPQESSRVCQRFVATMVCTPSARLPKVGYSACGQRRCHSARKWRSKTTTAPPRPARRRSPAVGGRCSPS